MMSHQNFAFQKNIGGEQIVFSDEIFLMVIFLMVQTGSSYSTLSSLKIELLLSLQKTGSTKLLGMNEKTVDVLMYKN